ncbi:hypothetical protein FZEAL_9934 [Fusarium zealandicum]|uniref:NAD-dependent epimerase/dehydratase domain-containing protein n=1 Tax=Fusarium zealandicum TaxID=1053134 RepID=A0A8H4U7Q0_9HYPO|nr:hypothetical protein FZEAL_9934 [Fusarium zealandicum]
MGAIAIAGGTGCLDRTIVDSLVAKDNHKALVLSRQRYASREDLGTTMVAVDYSRVDGLVAVLEENMVDTVISTIDVMQSVEPDLNLLSN